MSKILNQLTDDIYNGLMDANFCGCEPIISSIFDKLGDNAKRMLEVGAVQDELVKLGFSRFGLCDYVLTDNKGTQMVGIDFVNLIISTSYFGGEQYYYSYASPNWQEELINRVKGLINE